MTHHRAPFIIEEACYGLTSATEVQSMHLHGDGLHARD